MSRGERVDLGSVDPAGSRHLGRRSAVAVTAGLFVVGRADGTLLCVGASALRERWRVACDRPATSIVAAVPFAGDILVGERSPRGEVRRHDAATGDVRWRVTTAETVGRPAREGRLFRPFVTDLVVADGRAYVAARRYDRDAGDRSFESVVAAVDTDGTVAWRYRTDASPVALDADADRVAVAYNRCPGAHDDGVVVLDAATGRERLRWHLPATDADRARTGDRRAGDVSLLPDGLAVASHADSRGYRLAVPESGDATVCWQVDLATPTTLDGGTIYAYPIHVHATPAGVAFVTGNTYAAEGRDVPARHDRATAAVGYTPAGEPRWSVDLGGFVPGLAAAGRRLLVPVGQGFRTRDPSGHGVRVVDLLTGPTRRFDTEGVAVAVASDGEHVAAVEEPVRYRDDTRGAYRLHAVGTPN
ncbi:MAG: PQQ-binding-like beta-propeller repeat protein [Haloplanus sp.]